MRRPAYTAGAGRRWGSVLLSQHILRLHLLLLMLPPLLRLLLFFAFFYTSSSRVSFASLTPS